MTTNPPRQYPEIRFYRTEIDNRLLKNKIMISQSLYNVFNKDLNITSEVNDEFKIRMRGSMNNFATLFIVGEQGKFKSATGQSIAEDNDDTGFPSERILFDYEKYKLDLAKSQPKQWFIIDENAFKHGIGSIRIRHDIQNIIEQLRFRGNSLILISPELKYFDEKLFTFILEMLDSRLIVTCPNNSEPHESRKCECYFNNNYNVLLFETRSLVKRSGEYIGYYITKIKWNSQLYQEYLIQKNLHVEKVKDGKSQTSPYHQIATDIISKPESIRYFRNKKSIKLLINEMYPSLTSEETQLTLEKIMILIEKQKEQGEIEVNNLEETDEEKDINEN